jgi:hypothetical protein
LSAIFGQMFGSFVSGDFGIFIIGYNLIICFHFVESVSSNDDE